MRFLLTGFFISFFITSLFAIEQNQWDNFQNGTTQGWGHGTPNPYQPVVVMDGGPNGSGDAYLYVTSSGTSGAGSMLITFNTAQWAGNYISAGVTTISMHMKNFGNESLSMRVCVQRPGDNFWSVTPFILAPQSNWQVVQFSLSASHLTGGTDLNATLSGVTQLRILHSVAGGYQADVIAAQLGIDNISAASSPIPVELTSFTAVQNQNFIILNWVTATEINNAGFEIERKVSVKENEGSWNLVAFKEGSGTSAHQNNYIYSDDISNLKADRIEYRLKQIDFDGSFSYSNSVLVENLIPQNYSLSQNFPNPFNPSTIIKFNIPGEEFVSLKIFNALGKEVAVLVNERKSADSYEVEFNTAELPSGVYYYYFKVGNFSETKKMILLR